MSKIPEVSVSVPVTEALTPMETPPEVLLIIKLLNSAAAEPFIICGSTPIIAIVLLVKSTD